MPEHKVGNASTRVVYKTLFYVSIIVILFILLFPFVWMILASFKKNADILNVKKMISFTPTLKNYISVFVDYDFYKPLKNSCIISCTSTILAMVLGLPCAYAIGRAKMHFFSGIILMIRIVPAISFLVPWYLLFTKLGLTGTYTSLIICHFIVSLPTIIWIMIPYFETIPKALEESAKIDGASNFKAFISIMIPLAKPGIFTSGILAFINSWNNFMFAQILCSSRTTTLPIAIYQFISYANINWGGIMAASVIITLPIILISFLLQRHVITGLTAGAVKG